MAEGGEEKDKNPFSYQEFVKRGNSKERKDRDSSDDIEVDLISEPDIGLPRKKESNRTSGLDEESRNHRREENPFSLKQFLSREGGARPKARSQALSSAPDGFPELNQSQPLPPSPSPSCERRNHSATPDVTSGLPDFVQDHFYTQQSLREAKVLHRAGADNVEKLPDFTFNGQPSSPLTHQSPWTPPGATRATNSDDPLELPILNKNGESGIGNSLPDFLSDGPMLSNHVNNDPASLPSKDALSSGIVNGVDRPDSNALSRLRAENEMLHRQLQEANETVATRSRRITELEREVTNLRMKETEETAALEKMVKQVEKNLQATTQRALSAESMVVKLKQEIKSLQTIQQIVREDGESLRTVDLAASAIKHKATSASHQITLAANSAEQSLRQLLSGVESLRMVASVLAEIDKVTESPFVDLGDLGGDDDDNDGSSRGAAGSL